MGIGLNASARPPRCATAVSQAMRAIRDQGVCRQPAWDLARNRGASGYRVLVASDFALRERAARLAYRVYAANGYAPESESGLLWAPYDLRPETFVLLIVDATGSDAATVSLTFDGPDGLPCDELYRAEVDGLRAVRRHLVEVVRLAIREDCQGHKEILVSLFNFISVFARHQGGGTDFVVEVNPRHVGFYRRLLMFEALGGERVCPRVNGAPAELLRLDLDAQAAEVAAVGGSGGQARGPNGRTLYSCFCSLADEAAVAAFLAQNHRPLNKQDAARLEAALATQAAGTATHAASAL